MKILGIAILLVFIFAASRWWRQRQRRYREQLIERYGYRSLLDQRLAQHRPTLTVAQREMVFEGLKQYFHLCNAAGQQMVAMPSQVVDDAWHEFILFTRAYQRYCEQALGRFLHHTPAEAMSSPTVAQDGIKRAWRLACQREGINPKQPAKLPLLFAIDGLLGISNGFRYQLDCMAAGQAGSGYCASHIGCGGGCSGDSGDASDSGGSGCGGGCGGD
ncbi:MAG: hypothetical protein H6943_00500 [Zoogloeaceae bacterium]|nr:hypothetical protein [Zoogloeaceae bacterium]